MTIFSKNKLLAWTMTLCLLVSACAVSVAEEGPAPSIPVSDFEVLQPLMDVVVGAVMTATEEPEAVPGAEGTLSASFVSAFFRIGQEQGAPLGIAADMLSNTEQQAALLASIFAAQVPALQPIEAGEAIDGYIGFLPMTVNNAAEAGGIQIIGELYWAGQPITSLSEAEYTNISWLERGIFTFQNDPAAMNGFRLEGFSVGTELDLEEAMQGYFDEILVEYVNTGLGFSMQYPSVFSDELLQEDSNGVEAKLPDGSASFFAKRVENTNQSNLEDYVNVIANGITGAKASINEQFQYATVSYTTEEGFTVFDVYIVTDKYVYQAELSYRTELSAQYHMYQDYLENTFNVDEISMG